MLAGSFLFTTHFAKSDLKKIISIIILFKDSQHQQQIGTFECFDALVLFEVTKIILDAFSEQLIL